MSWYPKPIIKYENEEKYLNDIQTIFKVMDAKRRWVPYTLEPHQVEWHLDDVALKGPDAKHKIVVKSRNTSFTVSSVITILMSVPFYPSQVIPIVRLNQTRANDLINDFKEIIKNMNVIKEPDGSYFPFNPNEVYMDAVGSIKFPNGVEIRAFPCSNSSAETIRGLRIAGLGGLLDEVNYAKDFQNVYIALRDAAAGSIEGKKEFQLLIGSTRKGRSTPFNLWFEEIEKIRPTNMQIYRWPVFDPAKTDLQKPFTEQNLDPIVHWHDVEDLENKRLENINRFREEYMAELTDGDSQFYEWYVVQNALQTGEKYECQQRMPEENKNYYIGIDVASGVGQDYFVISIFLEESGHYLQQYLNYTRDKELPQMEEECIRIINTWNPKKVRIDSVGNGTQISQRLLQLFGPTIVEPVKGGMSVKGIDRRIPLNLNEFAHTNLKSLMANKYVGIINDELQTQHFFAWDNNYKADSGASNGHGDIVIANMFACLPEKWKYGKGAHHLLTGTNLKQPEEKEEEIKTNILKRVDWYKKQAKKAYQNN